jgi:acetyl-CoA carboxylase carboxyl transferase subunit alpha
LWKDGTKADLAASRLKMTAPDLLDLRVVDRVVEEPPGGAHQDLESAAKLVSTALEQTLRELLQLTPDELSDDRYKRFRALGAFIA